MVEKPGIKIIDFDSVVKTQSRKINYFNEILLPMLYNRSSEAADMDYF